MSKPSRDDRKKAARKKVLGAVHDPFAVRLLDAWQAVEASRSRLDAWETANGASGADPASNAEWLALATRVTEKEARFDGLTATAIGAKNFHGTLSSLQHLVTKRGATPPTHQSLINMRRMMGAARMNQQILLETELGPLAARTALVGVPAFGTPTEVARLAADLSFEALVQNAGGDPDACSVGVLGAMRIADAVALSLDPLLQWRLTDYLERRHCALTDGARHQVPGNFSYLPLSETPEDAQVPGAYVILTGVFTVGRTPEDDCLIPALGGLNAAQHAAWEAASAQLGGAVVGLPCSVADAASSAIGLQLLQALAGEGDGASRIAVRAAFIQEGGEVRLLGQFADGSIAECPGLDANALFLLGDVARHFPIPVDLIDADQRESWLT